LEAIECDLVFEVFGKVVTRDMVATAAALVFLKIGHDWYLCQFPEKQIDGQETVLVASQLQGTAPSRVHLANQFSYIDLRIISQLLVYQLLAS
jgi:hypothetical protein